MRIRKMIGGGVAAGAVLVMTAAPAFAHVTVNPKTATQGGFQTLTFQVPNEMDNANTVKLDVKLPSDHPFASVSVQPKAGWTYQVLTAPLPTPITNDDGQQVTDAASEVIWSGGEIKPGEFDTFVISVGTLPDDADSIAFPAVQSYDNGQDVSWIDPVVEGQPEPDHPVPTVELVKATDTGGDPGSTASSSSSGGTAVVGATVVKKETNNTLGIIALIVGAVGVIIGAIALARGRGGQASQT